jgi:cytochrome c5
MLRKLQKLSKILLQTNWRFIVSTHSDSINPMSSFLKFSGISIASIIILILLNNLLFKHEANEEIAQTKEAAVDPKQTEENIKPIGQVTLAAASSTDAVQAPRSGEEIYKTTCSVCHLTGVANAPKIEDKAAWEPRVVAGLASLITNATNGKGAMPPRGGKADLSDDELKATILHMTKLAGFDLGEATVEQVSAPASVPPAAISEVPASPEPVVTPQAPIPAASEAVIKPEASITPEAAALGYVLVPPTQPLPSTQPIAPQFPQQTAPVM